MHVLLLTECGESAGGYLPVLTGRLDVGYAASGHDPATGLSRDDHRVRRVSILPLLKSALKGSCLR